MASESENNPESAPPPLRIVAMDAGAGAGAGPRVPLDGPRRGAAEAAAPPGGAGTEGAHYCVCLG